jgi:hypothetical protein
MDLPGLTTTTHQLSGDFETLTANLVDNLENRWNWGVGYLEAYINANDQRVYQVGGVRVARDPVDISKITNISMKIIEVGTDNVEIDVSTRIVSVRGYPFNETKTPEIKVPTDDYHHDELANELVSFCHTPHHESMTLAGVMRRFSTGFDSTVEKRKSKR